ncbi:hypothetical protein SLEP1_g58111 [Rubroshorea leprosula]|uniref:Uncharacterized protein n=1 Tax=Rubroshorea leprosula TaxID=152421 RepID=A0AAV5MNN9_9ROSI|nr:hypothetical protein SLEP1_g58111 [Rubroshorea leprosula]
MEPRCSNLVAIGFQPLEPETQRPLLCLNSAAGTQQPMGSSRCGRWVPPAAVVGSCNSALTSFISSLSSALNTFPFVSFFFPAKSHKVAATFLSPPTGPYSARCQIRRLSFSGSPGSYYNPGAKMSSSGGSSQPTGQPQRPILRRQMAGNLGEAAFDSEVVPSSLSEIAPILRGANEVESSNGRVAYLCKFVPYLG